MFPVILGLSRVSELPVGAYDGTEETENAQTLRRGKMHLDFLTTCS